MDVRIPDKDRHRIQHAFNKLEWHIPADVRTNGRFLDIGCGIGNGVIAALKHGVAFAMGIDRDLEEFGPRRFQKYCDILSVKTNNALLLRVDIDDVEFGDPLFDFAMMLDTIEHVPDPARFIRFAYDNLRPGGHLLLDTCPLYYSPHGGHLFNHFTEAEDPWVHLYHDCEFDNLVRAKNVDDWTLARYNELNKVTHDDVARFASDCGFSVVQEHRAKPSAERLALYERHKHRIDHRKLPDRSLLYEDWILLVCKK